MPSYSFGPYVLVPERQSLMRGQTAVRIGSRALEILVALIERPGELVSKAELVHGHAEPPGLLERMARVEAGGVGAGWVGACGVAKADVISIGG